MATQIANIYQAKTNLSQLIEQVLVGKDVVIAKAGKPVARLVPYVTDKKPRIPGKFKGHFVVSDDFDKEDEEIEKMFYESDEDAFYS